MCWRRRRRPMRSPTPKWNHSWKNATPPRRRRTLDAPMKSGHSFSIRESFWKTPRAACDGRGNRKLKIHTKAVHAGDRKKLGAHVPVTTPIYTASAYSYDSMEQLDRIFGQEEEGPCYARYDNPSAAALEEAVCALEGGRGALVCSSGMAALHVAVMTALTDRRRTVVAANSMYGATTSMLMNVFEPGGVDVRFADVCNLDSLRTAVAEAEPGCIL